MGRQDGPEPALRRAWIPDLSTDAVKSFIILSYADSIASPAGVHASISPKLGRAPKARLFLKAGGNAGREFQRAVGKT